MPRFCKFMLSAFVVFWAILGGILALSVLSGCSSSLDIVVAYASPLDHVDVDTVDAGDDAGPGLDMDPSCVPCEREVMECTDEVVFFVPTGSCEGVCAPQVGLYGDFPEDDVFCFRFADDCEDVLECIWGE